MSRTNSDLLDMSPDDIMAAYDAAVKRGDQQEVARLREFIIDRLYQSNFI
ncbi:hypothetical protein GZH47_32950 (plasmid) [Paenibacillus rhizovicinus]|uniref:Sporulation histidine kinase inhibitor Sda n=1 Tax=Paenibacillus rhizovicinus TaxID=2704463 RepID=A0A6C0PCJ1_9BACL|nr:hypothetical protein [Paenibacillus rhizovicinus]QHW35703.1 hypothetical protein GZH47_32950 [Paenibacillus rhizovicinus]